MCMVTGLVIFTDKGKSRPWMNLSLFYFPPLLSYMQYTRIKMYRPTFYMKILQTKEVATMYEFVHFSLRILLYLVR